MVFAAIDIGSNAVRLLFCNVYEKEPAPIIKKSSLIRVPIRLGEDVFKNGLISDEKADRLVLAMQAFKKLMLVYNVVTFRACATSAMREAVNGPQVVKRIKKEAEIDIEIIKGDVEAEIIFSTHLSDKFNDKKSYLYIDVGGGSSEITLFSKNKKTASRSFNIGTIRMLQQKDNKDEFNRMKKWIKVHTKDIKNTIAIGTGGNINKLSKLANKKDIKNISIEKLMELDAYLNKFTYQERIETLGLNPDRADVIVQATAIFIAIMKTAGTKKIFIPQTGLSDGIINLLYKDFQKKK
ncbi:MAG: ethanolamine ammonia-lyase reactivating factor EutA [Bacteroidetes bacterium]|nr:ethanolamine ammonia-lyase reactivating factor EutA [Bacteroidota bacterium]HET6242948.1 exopolyphosphatase [Bacteroidia bacterium]